MEQTEETGYAPPELADETTAVAPAEPTPNNPPWGVWSAIAAWAASIMLIILLPNLALLPYLFGQDNLDLKNEAQLREFADTDRIAVILRVAALIPAHLLTLLMGWAVVTRFSKFSFRKTLGWVNNLRWWNYCILLGGVYITAAIVAYFLPEQENDMIRILQSSRTAAYTVAFLATFTAPLVEEVIYRGILFSALQRAAGVVWAVLIVTLLFAGVHFAEYWGSPGTIVMICCLSLILTMVRYKTNNLLPCVILHTLINGLQSIALIVERSPRPAPEEAVPAAVSAIIHLLK